MKSYFILIFLNILYSSNVGFPQMNFEWMRRYHSPYDGYDGANAIAVDDSGNVFVTGISYVSPSRRDVITIKYNKFGDSSWTRRYKHPLEDWNVAYDISLDDSGVVHAV